MPDNKITYWQGARQDLREEKLRNLEFTVERLTERIEKLERQMQKRVKKDEKSA